VMARKMAVKSKDVLSAAARYDSLESALAERDLVIATTSRRGVSGVLSPREVARRAVEHASQGGRISFLFGNEKTGLTSKELELADRCARIPMAAAQPSVNLAQATQIIAYELLVAALEARERG
jgi:TrmH family RNA methyltransferase